MNHIEVTQLSKIQEENRWLKKRVAELESENERLKEEIPIAHVGSDLERMGYEK